MAPYIDPGLVIYYLFIWRILFLRKDDEKGWYTWGGTVKILYIIAI